MRHRRLTALFVGGLSLVAVLVGTVGRQRAMATPVFAQAYGVACTTCHTQMPMLNAFGRYVQRTGYAALDPKTLRHAVPVFLWDLGTADTHQAGNPQSDHVYGPFHVTFLQANGALSPDLTYKVEQFLIVGGNSGFLSEGWLAYHNILKHKGHLFVGKVAPINLDEYGAGVLGDVNTAGSVPNVAVGVHNYLFNYSTGRWGAKFNYVAGKTFVQVAYVGNPTGLGSFQGAYNYSPASDRSVQWRAAYADPAKPWELGVFGETGTLGFTGAALVPGLHTDHYGVVAPYVMKDPRSGSPGFRVEYAMASDSNPGYVTSLAGPPQPAGATASSWIIGSVYQMVLHDHGMVNVTYYHTNQAIAETGFTGLTQGTPSQTGIGPGVSYAINPYVRIYTNMYVIKDEHPAFSVSMWFTPPLWSRLK